ncbi:MAG: radical SAM protein [Nitrososphaerota archaeon]|nr:radical SAM protein [Candidatus Bathyarchaeota archaeon]MDW8049091.1 radical SAM protein [Nitrososphaerota archaeon]
MRGAPVTIIDKYHEYYAGISMLGKVRVSLGSAVVLGLSKARLDSPPTTIYLLTYRSGKCLASCAFCPQSRISRGRRDMLSRIIWPVFKVADVISRIPTAYDSGAIKRVCIQAINYPGVLDHIEYLVDHIHSLSDVPISVSCQPITKEWMARLADKGVERVSIPLDAANKAIFEKVKGDLIGGPYRWDEHMKSLKDAVDVFGWGMATTHLIIGLGETEEDIVRIMQECVDIGVYPSLFAFTPIPGTKMERHHQPTLLSYRKAQVAQYLVTRGLSRYEEMRFAEKCLIDFGVSREKLKNIISSGEPFKTSGCPGCNRPYYNEKPSGPIYNFPRDLTEQEIAEIQALFRGFT